MTPPPDNRCPVGPYRCSADTTPELVARIHHVLSAPRRDGLLILCLNAHIFNAGWCDERLRTLLNGAEVLAADGMSIVWASRLSPPAIPERCNMTEAFRAFLAHPGTPAASVTLIGCSEEEAHRAADAIRRLQPRLQIRHVISGYDPVEAYPRRLAAETPTDLVLLGMGTPKSEEVGAALRACWPSSVVWHVGGGTLLFLAGVQREAPGWMRRFGLQWLHRLLHEPGRMWRRYLIGNLLFVIRIAFRLRPERGPRA
ncbi:MAG TPA: WecB/TagA/CpsF family glycosyltransferase [Kiritimatiellia bacterium]|nr:WecB/TagA/CpsF family glycosyltransferase [Kiritimatiellia bacterium]